MRLYREGGGADVKKHFFVLFCFFNKCHRRHNGGRFVQVLAPCSFPYCGAKSSLLFYIICGQNNCLAPPVGTFPRSLASIFRTAPHPVEGRGCETQ